MQYDKMKFSVGIFVLILIIVVTTFLYFLLEEKGTFDKRYSYHFNTQSAESFSIGMPLKFSGFNIGTLDDIELLDDGSVYMTFSISEKNKKWISVDTILMLKKPLIGSPHIEIYSVLDNPPLKDGSSLDIIMSDDINDLIAKLDPVVEKAMSIITSIDTLTKNFADKDSDFMQTLKNINLFTAKLAHNSLLTTMTDNQKSTQSIIDSLNQMAHIMKDIKKMSDDMSKLTASLEIKIIDPASNSMREVEKIMKDIKSKLEAIDGTVQAVGMQKNDLTQLKEQISVGLQKSNQIMDKVDALMQDDANSELLLP